MKGQLRRFAAWLAYAGPPCLILLLLIAMGVGLAYALITTTAPRIPE